MEGSIRLKSFTNPHLSLNIKGGISLEKIPFFCQKSHTKWMAMLVLI